jgi:ADP-heptose:LPS heptosyltransferase
MRKLKLLALRFWVWIHIRNHPEQLIKISTDSPMPESFRVKNILVFSNTAMGDTLLSTPAMVNLRHCFPDARICLFIHKNMRPMFEGLPFIDHMIDFHGSYHRFRETINKLKNFKPDVALLLHSNAPQDIPMAILAGARIILKPETRSQFKHYLSLPLDNTGQHIIQERNRLVAALGCQTDHEKLHLPDRYQRVGTSGEVRIGFQLGAADGYKMWPVEYFAELASRIHEHNNAIKIIITGSSAEKKLCHSLQNLCPGSFVINECGLWTIETLPELVSSLDLLITNDTGTMHLAIALGIPTISLFSPTSAKVFGPLQDLDKHTVFQEQPLEEGLPKKKRSNAGMRQISVEKVFDQTRHFLEEMSAT